MMRIRTGLLICCCALLACTGLAGCTASAPKGPNVTVSTPSVGRPQPPASAQAALSRMAFTPYAALGQASNDGLAPNESSYALAQACLDAAGYPGAGNVPFAVSLGPANLSFAQPWGAWGYLGTAPAQQYGFRAPAGLGAEHPGNRRQSRGRRIRPTSPRRSRPRSARAARSGRSSPIPSARDRWPASSR